MKRTIDGVRITRTYRDGATIIVRLAGRTEPLRLTPDEYDRRVVKEDPPPRPPPKAR